MISNVLLHQKIYIVYAGFKKAHIKWQTPYIYWYIILCMVTISFLIHFLDLEINDKTQK